MGSNEVQEIDHIVRRQDKKSVNIMTNRKRKNCPGRGLRSKLTAVIASVAILGTLGFSGSAVAENASQPVASPTSTTSESAQTGQSASGQADGATPSAGESAASSDADLDLGAPQHHKSISGPYADGNYRT